MKKQFLSVPVQYDTSIQLQADDLKIPVEILVMHDQINLNQSNFDFEVIDNEITKESIKNIPILGYIKKIDGSDEQDFAGHEMEVVIKDGEIKVVYLERPIGVVPETNNYEYVEKDGKKYVKVIGYLWKDYLNEGYEILQENPNKSVSMEIIVDAYELRKDGIIDIKAYRYTGITVLGDDVLPGMSGANIQVIGQFSENQKFSQEFYERVEKLNLELRNFQNQSSLEVDINNNNNNKEGGKELVDEKLELLKKYNLAEETISFKIEELSLEEIESKIAEHFALLASQKQEEIINALRAETFKDRWGDEYFRYSYVDNSEAEVFAYDRQDNWRLYGFTYSMNGDNVAIDFESKKRKKFEIVDFIEGDVVFELLSKEAVEYEVSVKEKELQESFSAEKDIIVKEIKDEYNNKISEYETNLTSLTEQFNLIQTENSQLKELNASLSEFKTNTEQAQQEAFEKKQKELKEELVTNFSKVLTAEEIQSVVDKDLSIEEMEKDFKLIYAEKDLQIKFNKKNNKKTETEIPLLFAKKSNKDSWTSCIKK